MPELKPIGKEEAEAPQEKTSKDPMKVLIEEVEEILGVPLPKSRKAHGIKK